VAIGKETLLTNCHVVGPYEAWSRIPRNPADSPDPAVRVISACERFYQTHCRLYAVDRTVVYRPEPR